MKLEFHPEAEMEFMEAAVRDESIVPELGQRFALEAQRAAELLLQRRRIGVPVPDSALRKLVLPRFPFTLYYSAATETLRLEVVAHHSRRSGYWKSRFEPE
ncbi:MAG: hypothetical protein M9885_13405 [Burkholderiaceae bacterium]|nr:hypothetical protein [Burkholderiaceae bacterium]